MTSRSTHFHLISILSMTVALFSPKPGFAHSDISSRVGINGSIQPNPDDDYAIIVSDTNLPTELSRLRDRLAKRQAEFTSFEYSGFKYDDVEKIKKELQTSESFLNLKKDKDKAMAIAWSVDKKLQATGGGCDYRFWVLDFIYSEHLERTLPQINQIRVYLNEEPKAAYSYLSVMDLPSRVDAYKKILDRQQYVDLQIARIPGPFEVLVELYLISQETSLD